MLLFAPIEIIADFSCVTPKAAWAGGPISIVSTQPSDTTDHLLGMSSDTTDQLLADKGC